MIESIVLGIATLIVSFYSGAISEAETSGKITQSISYNVDINKTEICKEFDTPKYLKIIVE